MNQNNSKEILELNELEDGSFELYSSFIGLFGYIRLTTSKTYYVFYYNTKFEGFLKAKHIIFITQKLNELNNYDKYKESLKHGR